MRTKTILGFTLTGLFSVLLATSYFVLCTATGLAWYLNQNITDSGTTISIAEVDQALNGNCRIVGLKLDTAEYQVEFSKLELSWNPLAVLRQEIEITSLDGENVSFRSDKSNLLHTSTNSIQLPFSLKIDQGSISQLSLKLADSYNESFQHVNIEQMYLHETFYANKLSVTLDSGDAFVVSGKAGLRVGDVVNLTTKATFTIPATGKVISSHGTIVGTPEQLKFLQNLNVPYASRINGSVINLFTNPYWKFTINVHSLNGAVINPRFSVDAIQGELVGVGSLDNLKIEGDLTLEDSLSRRWHLLLTSVYDSNKTVFNVTSTLPGKPGKSSPASIELDGSLDHVINAQFPQSLTVAGTVKDLEWPINDASSIQVRQGVFKFEGNSFHAEFTADDLRFTSMGTHLSTLTINTDSKTEKKIIVSGNARTNDGSIQFSGDLEKRNLGYQIANLSLTGRNFALVRKPKAHIIISPDITFSRSNQVFESVGVIKVPTANIQLQGVSETYNQLVKLFINNSHSSIKTAQSINQLNLEFGKSVWMHGYGLNAHVTGDLSLINLSNDKLIADGKLNVLRGNYKNHKKHFSVSGGTLKFNKKRLDNPDLELKIVQKNNTNSASEILEGPLQSLHTAQDKAPEKDLSQQDVSRVALNGN